MWICGYVDMWMCVCVYVRMCDYVVQWLAATIAEEPFSFEPFLVGSYGDCGVMLHFDPTMIHHPKDAKPFYINAEWYLGTIRCKTMDCVVCLLCTQPNFLHIA
jgi:hypothetical protein